jgi:hypothetical protein
MIIKSTGRQVPAQGIHRTRRLDQPKSSNLAGIRRLTFHLAVMAQSRTWHTGG